MEVAPFDVDAHGGGGGAYVAEIREEGKIGGQDEMR